MSGALQSLFKESIPFGFVQSRFTSTFYFTFNTRKNFQVSYFQKREAIFTVFLCVLVIVQS